MRYNLLFACLFFALSLQTVAQAQWVQKGSNLNSRSAGWPAIAVDGGKPYVTWTEDNGSGTDLIWVKAFDGTNWVPVGNASLNTVNTCTAVASVIAFNNGMPYVAWEEFSSVSGQGRQIYVKHFNGSAWVPDGGSLNVLATGDSDGPCLGFTAAGVPYVCWTEQHGYSPGAHFLYVKHFNGSSWVPDGSNLNLNTAKSCSGPSLAVLNDVPYVSWAEDTSTMTQVYVKHWDGGNWVQAGGSLNIHGTCNAQTTNLAVINSKPYLAWSETNATGNTALAQVFVKHWTGTNWEADGGAINCNLAWTSGYPRLTSHNGTAFVTWLEIDPVTYAALGYMGVFNGQQWRVKDTAIGPLGLLQWPSMAFVNDQPLVAYGNNQNQGQIKVVYPSERLSLVMPNYSVSGRNTTVLVTGSPFALTPTAKLSCSGSPDITCTSATQVSANGFACTFNLSGAAADTYDVLVSSGTDGYQAGLNQAFSILSPSTAAPLWTMSDLGAPSAVTEAAEYCGLAVGDVDGDRQQELYVATDSLYQYKKYSYGWTVNAMTSGAGNNVYSSVVLADTDGDRIQEAIGSQLGNQLYQFTGATWVSANLGSGGTGTVKLYSLTQADMDQDGFMEIYAAGDRGLVCQYANTLSAWSKLDIPAGPTPLPNAAYVLAAGDGNNDGLPELYSANADYKIYQYTRSVAGTWAVTVVGSGTGGMNAVAVGDGDNDGKNEVYAACQDGKIYQFRWNGTNWTSAVIFQSPVNGNAIYSVAVSDGSNNGSNKVYGSCLDHHVYECQYSGGAWVTTALPDAGTPLYALVVGPAGNDHHNQVYAIGKNNHVFEFMSVPPAATPTPVATAATALPQNFFKIYHNQIDPNHGEQARIIWTQEQSGPVTITLYNLLGDKIATLLDNRICPAGQYNELDWNGKNQNGNVVGSGIYLAVLQINGRKQTGKIAVVK